MTERKTTKGKVLVDRSNCTPSRVERRLLDAHGTILSGPPEETAYLHTVLTQCSLPYKPTDARRWERRQGRARLVIQAGEVLDPHTGEFVPVGLPHGERPRLALIHVTTQALRTGSPVVEVEASLKAFARSLGVDVNGPSLRMLRDQLTRLACAHVRLGVLGDNGTAFQVQGHMIEELELWSRDPNQHSIWPSTVTLGVQFFESVLRHAVPLDPRAIAALASSALALDVYSWLAQRLHRIPKGKPQFVPWPALQAQFGAEYDRIRDFRRKFVATAKRVQLVYPAAHLDVTLEGMALHHSRPPITKPMLRIGKGTMVDATPEKPSKASAKR